MINDLAEPIEDLKSEIGKQGTQVTGFTISLVDDNLARVDIILADHHGEPVDGKDFEAALAEILATHCDPGARILVDSHN